MNIVWTLTITGCLVYLQPCCADLKLLQTVFRHGNRMPTIGASIYPKDPYIKNTYEPQGFGGLTNVGKMSSYKLGEYFRKMYDKFLGPTYSKEVIWFRADEIERIVMTGELVAAGLYPPVKEQIWNFDLNWQPIPVWAPPISIDYLYNGMFCENFKKWRNEVETTDRDLLKFEHDHKECYKYLSNHTGTNITQRNTFTLRQILYAQEDIGLELPAWTESVFPNKELDKLAVHDILIRTRTTKLKQLTGGIWILEWLKHIENYLNQNDTRKAFMYASHELNIASILVALENFDNEIPSYSSCLIFELHEDKDQYYVEIFYRNSDKHRALKIPGCNSSKCPLETFKKFVEPVLPENVKELCGKVEKSSLHVKHQTNY